MATFWKRAAHAVGHTCMFPLYFDYFYFSLHYFPLLFSGRNLGSDCSSSWSLYTCYFYQKMHKAFFVYHRYQTKVLRILRNMTKNNFVETIRRNQMSLVGGNRSSGFPTKSDTNRAVQPQEMARVLKFRI